MIQETCLEIGELEQRWTLLREAQHARRKRIRLIDELIEEFEKLNLAEEQIVPLELRTRVLSVVGGAGQALATRADEAAISEWMDALYEAQDSLMFGAEDGD